MNDVAEKNKQAREREMEIQRKKIQASMNPTSPKEARSATPILHLDSMSAQEIQDKFAIHKISNTAENMLGALMNKLGNQIDRNFQMNAIVMHKP